MWDSLQSARTKPVQGELSDADRAFIQPLTWGTAGAGLVILTAIVTSSAKGTALTVAAGCCAVATPLLVAFGFIYPHLFMPKREPPAIVQQVLNIMLLIHGAQILFCAGIVAMLYSFNRAVALVFLVGCLLGWRAVSRFTVPVKRSEAIAAPPKAGTLFGPEYNPAMTNKPPAPEPDTETNEAIARRMMKDNARKSGALIPPECTCSEMPSSTANPEAGIQKVTDANCPVHGKATGG
jgi:hypothetical protein